MQEHKPFPNVKADCSRGKDGTWDIKILCPFCGEHHVHGGGNGPKPQLGSRLSHCSDPFDSETYIIVAEVHNTISNKCETCGDAPKFMIHRQSEYGHSLICFKCLAIINPEASALIRDFINELTETD